MLGTYLILGRRIKQLEKFYILLTVHPEEIVGFNQLDTPCSLFSMCLFFHLYMFRATSAHHQEGKNCINTSSGTTHWQGDCPAWRTGQEGRKKNSPDQHAGHLASVLYQRMC
jgi:hypothetical protein